MVGLGIAHPLLGHGERLRAFNVRRALIISGTLLAGPAHAAPSAWLQEQTRHMHRIAGPFVSTDFGFSVEPPPEASEYVSNGGDADHGPVLILGDGRAMIFSRSIVWQAASNEFLQRRDPVIAMPLGRSNPGVAR
jgi:hypothetical protein